MIITQNQYTHEDLLNFVTEAQEIHGIWRPQAWYSEEMVDGQQWSDTDYQKALDAGIFDPNEDPMVINRTFPTVQLLLGLQITNKFNSVAKGRTSKDSEIGQLMSEGIAFINDQSGSEYLISRAYKDQIVPGVGFLKVGHSRDPREEEICVKYRDWKEMWWDPMADPWLNPAKCRYAFHMPYVDMQDLIAMFPKHEADLKDYTKEYTSKSYGNVANVWYDEAQQVEDWKTLWGRSSRSRHRVRPVEMWYPVWRKSLWAKMPDGSAYEMLETMPPRDLYQMIQSAQKVISSMVRRMWTTTFLDNIVLSDGPTPYNHDKYPFVPFVGYLDRYGQPYGVPHQMKGQQVEVNKRRAMILALLRKRRMIIETDAVGDAGKPAIDNLAKQAGRLDGVMILAPGGKGKMELIEGTDRNQLQSQLLVQQQSEKELQEISGANAEMQGIRGQSISGIAMQERKQQSSVILAPLLENLRRSRFIMSDLEVSEIQGRWDAPKILRITDRYTGAEKWVTLNELVPDWKTGEMKVQNNVTQGKFDIIISEAPATDTVREANLQLITEAVKKSPPEIIPQLITMAFEMSNLPNKDMLVTKLKEIYKIAPGDEDMSPEQMKQRTLQVLEEQQRAAQAEQAYDGRVKQLTLDNLFLENKYLQAQIEKIMGDKTRDEEKSKNMRDEIELKGYKTGFDIGDRIHTKKIEALSAGRESPGRKEINA